MDKNAGSVSERRRALAPLSARLKDEVRKQAGGQRCLERRCDRATDKTFLSLFSRQPHAALHMVRIGELVEQRQA
ncbi:hypothetical protein C3408_20715 [Candidatus Pantoea alvi]|nr:hypothetical protein C3408_20715 [Pantoea alvi]